MFGIVIADDDVNIREGLKNINWAQYDIEVVGIAGDGISALHMIKEKKPDLVIIDIKMPGINGIELIKEAKNEWHLLKVLIITGYQDFHYAYNAIKLDVNDFILKPSSKEEIISAVVHILNEDRDKIRKRYENLKTYDNTVIKKVIEYIHENYYQSITLKDLSNHVHLNPAYLSRLIKKETNKTFQEILTEFRMEKSEFLLINTNMSIYEISQEAGFIDARYFSQLFKKTYGLNPLAYRKDYMRQQKNDF